MACEALYALARGLTARQVAAQRECFGPNRMHVRLTPLAILLVKQLMQPFYVFQAFAIALWFAGLAYPFASALLVISLLSLAIIIVATHLVCCALLHSLLFTFCLHSAPLGHSVGNEHCRWSER